MLNQYTTTIFNKSCTPSYIKMVLMLKCQSLAPFKIKMHLLQPLKRWYPILNQDGNTMAISKVGSLWSTICILDQDGTPSQDKMILPSQVIMLAKTYPYWGWVYKTLSTAQQYGLYTVWLRSLFVQGSELCTYHNMFFIHQAKRTHNLFTKLLE